MKSGAKRIWAVLLVLVLILLMTLPGCKEDGPVTLRIVTEAINTSTVGWANLRLEQQLSKTILAYKESHENVKFVIEKIPYEGSERTNVLERLRAELMSGKGPDILLLPGNCLMLGRQGELKESLILDVNQAMRNGLFADISEYYDADTELGKESLNTTVMDAGVVDGARYVLPLRYDFPVAYVSTERFEKTGLSRDIFGGSILDFMNTAIEAEDQTAISMFFNSNEQIFENLLPRAVDYDGQQVLLTKEQLSGFCDTYFKYFEKCFRNEDTSEQSNPGRTDLVQVSENGGPFHYTSWLYSEHWMGIEPLDRAIRVKALGQFAGVDVEMYPLRAADGKLTADVTYYGAVSAGCENMDEAYDFLRQMLLEDFQWEQSTDADSCYVEFGAPGWPVRTKGSVNPLATGLRNQMYFTREYFPLKNALYDITDQDLPILNAQIDEVCFPISWHANVQDETVWMYWQDRNGKATANADALAEQQLKNLEWHLAES